MNLAFLFPLGFAALAAWAVPLLIHLRRRDEPTRRPFAALQWLREGARPSRQLRFTQWPLLLVRLAMLAALAMLLAGPVLTGAPQPSQWTVVLPGLDPAGLSLPEGERRWLAPGFPGIEARNEASRVPVGSLLRELDAQLPAATRLTVFVPDRLDGADAEVPRLQREVDWRVVPSVLSATRRPARRAARPPLAVRHGADRMAELRIFRAVAAAWRAVAPGSSNTSPAGSGLAETNPAGKSPAATSPTGTDPTVAPPAQARASASPLDIGPLDAPLPTVDRPLAWLAGGAPPARLTAWVERGGTALVPTDAVLPGRGDAVPLWRDDSGQVLVRARRQGRGRWLQWTRRVAPAAWPAVLESDFPERLWGLFAPAAAAPSRIEAAQYRPRTGGGSYPEPGRDLSPWLIATILALFLLERWLASAPRTGAAA